MAFNPETMSILHWCDAESHKCGYCKHENGSIANGLWAECLTVDDYQNMIDRGWRRSGKYCYKPTMNETCCPQYTIRCRALEFRASKSQKKVMKKVNRFLRDGTATGSGVETMRTEGTCQFVGAETKAIGKMVRLDLPVEIAQASGSHMEVPKVEGDAVQGHAEVAVSKYAAERLEVTRGPVKAGLGADPSKPKCKKAKVLRQERKLNANAQKGVPVGMHQKEGGSKEKSFLDLLAENSAQDLHKLEVKLIRLEGADWQTNRQVEFEVYKKYQTRIHGDAPDKCTISTFERFLASSPLESTNPLFGSFHQQYWLDKRLVAVGVIDVLPKCVSAVYFFYDPDYNHLTLGTYSALREIHFTQQLNAQQPSIEYYYMGYYIHTCPKMQYKGKFHPSDLLCPETYHWVPTQSACAKLSVDKYSRLVPDAALTDAQQCTLNDMHLLRIISRRGFTYLKDYKCAKRFEEVFRTLGVILGKQLIDSVFIVDLQ